jgi:chromosomal replication initiation ATPase DnaA
VSQKPRQLLLDLPLRQALGRDDFLVTSSNSAAVELIDQWPHWPTLGAIIVGPPGSGKSHLVEVWRQKAGAAISSAKDLSVAAVPQLFENGALAVEDLAEANYDERALFHALNLARQQGGQVLLTARSAPASWRFEVPDLASRLNALPVVSILPPDDALLRGVTVKLFSDRQINVDEAMVSFILLRMPRSLDAARALVAEIDRQALEQRAEVTKPFLSKVLATFSSPAVFDAE